MGSGDENASRGQELPSRGSWLPLPWLGAAFLLLYVVLGDPASEWNRAELSYMEFEHQLERDNVGRVDGAKRELQQVIDFPGTPGVTATSARSCRAASC